MTWSIFELVISQIPLHKFVQCCSIMQLPDPPDASSVPSIISVVAQKHLTSCLSECMFHGLCFKKGEGFTDSCIYRNSHPPSKQVNTVEPGYNDVGLCSTSPIESDILWYQSIPHC
jgi:hypothetical protein